jgi:hypothetical protein
MYIPAARERVVRRGNSGVFLVLYVDFERQEADLLPLTDSDFNLVEEGVEFKELEPFRDESLEAAS